MRKNVAGQMIGAQLINAATGAAFTGSVDVYVTLDAGTQAIGSVGSGACTHEGNGYHTYAPSQAETNGDLAAFTFIGTGAVPATVQVYTNTQPTAADIADAVLDEALSGHVTVGTLGAAVIDTDQRGARTVIRGTSASGATTTTMTPSAISPSGAVADQFKGRILIFDNATATAALRGQATDITANTSAALPVLTFTALTTAPASGDTFSIV